MVLEAIPSLWAPWATKAREANPDPRKEAFIQEYGPYAKRYGAMTGISPEVLLAIGASESNWGASGTPFGIKGKSSSGNSKVYDTWEAGPNGERIPQKAEFAYYDNPDEAFGDFAKLMQSERYKPALEHVQQTGDSAGFLRMINDAGYATDRNWANSIVALANGMGNGQFPDPPPPGEGKVSAGIGITLNNVPAGENGFQKMARLVVQKRINADEARQAVVDEEARARLETDLSRPMPELAHERTSEITPPSVGDGGVSRISPPGVDASIHPSIMPPGVDASVHPEGSPAAEVVGRLFGQPESDAAKTARLLSDFRDNPSLFSKVKDVAETKLPYADQVTQGVKYQLEAPYQAVTAPLLRAAGVNTDAPDAVVNVATDFAAKGAVPQTVLDAGIQVGPGKIAKGLGIAGDALKGAGAADEMLGIVSRNAGKAADARKMYETLRAAGHTDEDIVKAFGQQAVDLAKGGAASQQAVSATTGLATEAESKAAKAAYERVFAATGDKAAATEAARQAAGAEAGASKRLRSTVGELSDRMGPGVVDNATAAAGKAPDALSREADALDAMARPAEGSTLGDIASAAKRLGDPASEIRRQLYDGQEGSVRGGKGDTFTDAAKAERQAAATEERAAIESAGKKAESAARDEKLVGQGIRDTAAEAKVAEALAAQKEADQAAIAARQAVLAKSGGGVEAVLQAARDRSAAAADAAEEARLALEKAQADQGIRAAAAEASTGNAKLTQAERQAEQRAIEAHQARVEAADLEKRKAAWQVQQAQEKALAEAKGYHEGGIGKEIVGILGLPRAFSLSGDVGTARDLGLMVGTKEGRQAIARGGAAGLRSVIHNDADARLVIDEANKGSRWFGWASDGKNLPGERPYHAYNFGAGASAESRVPEMASLNESKISQAAERYNPAIKFSDRALAVQRNVAGVDLLESRLNELALKYGVSGPEDAARNARFLSEAQSTIDSVNHLRGYSGGSKAKALGALNFFTSPQQLFSRLQVIGDPINMALRGDTESAKFAASSLMGFASTQGALLALAKVTGGAGRWDVNLNPASSDFGTIRVGNTRYDAMAGLGPTMRLAAKGASAASDEFFGTDYAKNQAAFGVLITRWLANKEQPISRMVTDYMEQNKLPNEQTAINMLAPSIAAGFMQTLQDERGANKAQAVPGAALNFLGVGVNTYKTPDDLKRETAQDLGLGDYNALDDVQKLKVLAQLPDDAPKNTKQDERQKYDAMLKTAGVLPKPPDKDDGTPGETKSEHDKRLARNADVIANLNPDQQVQHWFWNSEATTLPSKEAVDKALTLNVPNREVKYKGSDRNLATEQGKALWAEQGKRVEDFYSPELIKKNMALADYYAQRRFEKPYALLEPGDKAKVDTSVRTAKREDDAGIDALLAYLGVGGSTETKRYLLHSEAAKKPLEDLRAKYGREAAQEGWGFATAANAR